MLASINVAVSNCNVTEEMLTQLEMGKLTELLMIHKKKMVCVLRLGLCDGKQYATLQKQLNR